MQPSEQGSHPLARLQTAVLEGSSPKPVIWTLLVTQGSASCTGKVCIDLRTGSECRRSWRSGSGVIICSLTPRRCQAGLITFGCKGQPA